jgi:hypothetical protein
MSDQIVCPVCGETVPNVGRECPNCGAELPVQESQQEELKPRKRTIHPWRIAAGRAGQVAAEKNMERRLKAAKKSLEQGEIASTLRSYQTTRKHASQLKYKKQFTILFDLLEQTTNMLVNEREEAQKKALDVVPRPPVVEAKRPRSPSLIGRLALIPLFILAGIGLMGIFNSGNTQAPSSATVTSVQTDVLPKITNTPNATIRASQKTATAGAAKAQETLAGYYATQTAGPRAATSVAEACLDLVNFPNNAGWRIFCDQFDNRENGWFTGTVSDEYWKGQAVIAGGKNMWKIDQTFQGFVTWDQPDWSDAGDFYASVEARRVNGPEASTCYGLWFRGSGQNYYLFEVCDNQTYAILAHSSSSGWDTLLDWSSSNLVRSGQANKLAVSANDDYFEFYINDTFINDVTDNRFQSGNVGIVLGLNKGDTATIEFDNFILLTP